MIQQDSHEKLTLKNYTKSGSNKSFGLVFATVFALIGLWPILNGRPILLWALSVSVLLVIISFLTSEILSPFNRVWFLFGLLLHKVISPVILGLIFYTTITPIGLIMKLIGKRPMPLNFDQEAKSYWIERKPPGPEPKSMTRQF